jgi:hypothetical protein
VTRHGSSLSGIEAVSLLARRPRSETYFSGKVGEVVRDTTFGVGVRNYVGVLISLWLFLFAAKPKAFFLNGLKKLEQRSHECVEPAGGGNVE